MYFIHDLYMICVLDITCVWEEQVRGRLKISWQRWGDERVGGVGGLKTAFLQSSHDPEQEGQHISM
jgi:hypothetical protein